MVVVQSWESLWKLPSRYHYIFFGVATLDCGAWNEWTGVMT